MEFTQIKEIDNKYSIITYPRHNLCMVRGDGNTLYDTNGRAYVDFVAGLGESCLGYKNPMLTEAIKAQTENIVSFSNLYYNELHSTLAQAICNDTPYTKVCFGGSIGDTLLIIAMMIRKFCIESKDSRNTVLAVTESEGLYDSIQNESLCVKTVKPNLAEFKNALTDDVCAVIFCPIEVDQGIKINKYEFLLSAYALCRSKSVLVTYDETSIGLGRTGSMFAFEEYGVQPDIVMIARGMGGGIPIAAILSRGEIATTLSSSDRINAFSISSVALVSALVVVERLKSGMLEEITAKGEYLMGKLSKLKKHNFVVDVRGIGLVVGIELTENLNAAKIIGQMESNGFLIDQTRNNTLRITPPFTINEREIDKMVESLSEIFAQTNL
ncbi:MAG: aminotransferase class III-fold pyridoxal phosphate-dependent enzyme [Clostridia bacterium]|nr:aminotransferase class III-fold pyridoxal phosphate-dependent enzyme [Clostridia bacterium]